MSRSARRPPQVKVIAARTNAALKGGRRTGNGLPTPCRLQEMGASRGDCGVDRPAASRGPPWLEAPPCISRASAFQRVGLNDGPPACRARSMTTLASGPAVVSPVSGSGVENIGGGGLRLAGDLRIQRFLTGAGRLIGKALPLEVQGHRHRPVLVAHLLELERVEASGRRRHGVPIEGVQPRRGGRSDVQAAASPSPVLQGLARRYIESPWGVTWRASSSGIALETARGQDHRPGRISTAPSGRTANAPVTDPSSIRRLCTAVPDSTCRPAAWIRSTSAAVICGGLAAHRARIPVFALRLEFERLAPRASPGNRSRLATSRSCSAGIAIREMCPHDRLPAQRSRRSRSTNSHRAAEAGALSPARRTSAPFSSATIGSAQARHPTAKHQDVRRVLPPLHRHRLLYGPPTRASDRARPSGRRPAG